MNSNDQYKLLSRIEANLKDAILAAGQLPGGAPLLTKLNDAKRLAEAWRFDQEAELSERCG